MPRFDFWKGLLFLLPFYVNTAGACEPVRELSPDVIQSFERYRESELKCGVEPAALPYLLRANPQVPLKGTIVLVHGIAGNPMHMRQIANRLQEEGYNVVAPLLQGHGGDDKMLSKAKLENWQKDVKFASEVAHHLASPHFIGGHSTGGVLAALEAGSTPGRFTAMVGLDPALNLSGSVAQKAKYACLGSWVATYESDPLVSMITGSPRHTFQEHVREVRDITLKAVEEHCGKGFPIPPYNTHYTLAGICALSQAVEQIKKISPKSLPPALVLESKDEDFYGPNVSREQMRSYVLKIPDSEIVKTDAQVHELMPANCSPGFHSYLDKISNWLGAYSRSAMVEGQSPNTVR